MTKSTTVLTIVGALALSSGAFGGPLRPEQVLPDSQWVVHIDVEGLMGSTLGLGIVQGGVDFEAELMEMKQQFGIDPLRDIKGITIFGPDQSDDTALIVVNATEAIEQPLSRIGELVPDYQTITEGSRTIHSWQDDGDERMYAYVKPGTVGGAARVMLISSSVDQLRAGMLGLERPAGVGPVSPALEGVAPRAGSMFFFSALELPEELTEDEGTSAILRFAETVRVDAGESNGRVFAEAQVRAQQPEHATNGAQVLQGLLALGRMAAGSDPKMAELVKLADACRVTTDGPTMTVAFEYDAAGLGAIVRSLEEADQAAPAEGADDAEDQRLREDLKKLEKTGQGGGDSKKVD